MNKNFERLAGFLKQLQHDYKASMRQYMNLNVEKQRGRDNIRLT